MKCIECGGELMYRYEEDLELNMKEGWVSTTNIYCCDKCKREFQIEISADIRKDSIETSIKRCGYYDESGEEKND